MLRGIRAKILMGFAAVIIVFIVAIAGNTLFQGKATMQTEQINRNYSKLTLVQELTDKIRTADGLAARYVMSNTDDERTKYLSAYEAKIPEITASITELKNAGLNEAELSGINTLESEWSNYLTVLEDAFAMAKEGNFPGAQKEFTNLSLDTIIDSQLVFEDVLNKEISAAQSQAASHRGSAMGISLGLTGLSVLLAAMIALLLSGRILKPIRDVNSQLQEIADGKADLTRKLTVRSKDEIGQLAHTFNQMTGNLGSIISQVSQSADSLAASSSKLTADSGRSAAATEQIAGIMGSVASGTDKQMTDLQTNMTTILEMSAAIQQIAASVQDISDASVRSAEYALSGDESLQAAARQMDSINASIDSLSKQVMGFVNRSQEIGSLVGIIKGIASQTNMLALNATIEAARAGEQGRGFAVVADQVRKLAEQSGESANLIAEMAAGIQNDASSAVATMKRSMSEVEEGTGIIGNAGHAFGEIRISVDSLAGQVQEVSGAVEEITAATDEIVESIRKVTQISETTASSTQHVSAASQEQMASVEQIASSASTLSTMAQALQGLVARFNVA
ncbi:MULTISPECIES: methyl-accepting chemotaxis protein [unclassified Paenibacillus]|uniref:methyl-accepting chemotaxis protein n=1 Tax=unclassified Paenibacillus TaxID=185978 RepID=UPI0024066294|nr:MULTISPECIES: methyl-accepting chemotaxis protein [unclassified Paenibacillus]MDF9845087.1 methyl-accepting chemotaxis protein [Paenibacillus sp. PastF-2]MDF9851682.1 methyl-accepting chemotaxis protein [Paenibacillus sp. PastM-2]MDF9858266.1 methyl-accepting chemotaxis protein [Paenibacillus sp. PastF-1]MDH6483530.1 methyl-accepting chemotaxis protein [Paenibacillus sp. PastH-2]MDH6510946.1 methyl-accepting chemotaxis protein [Paenibacillus sp. PastM-3]